MTEQEWLEDELMEVMRIVAPGMGGQLPDELTYAIMVTAIRRLMEADTDRYEALLERWQQRQQNKLTDNATFAAPSCGPQGERSDG